MKYYPAIKDRDHSIITITLSVVIGIGEEEDSVPPEYCDQIRELVRSTGSIIMASSFVSGKRLSYSREMREELERIAKKNTGDDAGSYKGTI